MWTRLFAHNSLKEAFLPKFVKGKWIKPGLSGRYKQILRNEFRIAGVPWVIDPAKAQPLPKNNPRNKKPKGHKKNDLKIFKLEKIKRALMASDEAMLKYRQERLNNRRLKGMDDLVSRTLPYWINYRHDLAEEEKEKENKKKKKKRADSDDEIEEKDIAAQRKIERDKKLFAKKEDEPGNE